MQRVLVVGPCGAGKSTFATALAARTGLPLIHMDQLAWKPGWIDSDRAEVLERLAPIVARDRWLIDGNYGSTLEARLPRADTVIHLDYAIPRCLWRLTRRVWRLRGTTRPDMTDGCPERFDPAFFWYAARWRSGPGRRLDQALAPHAEKVVRLPDPRAAAQWLANAAPPG